MGRIFPIRGKRLLLTLNIPARSTSPGLIRSTVLSQAPLSSPFTIRTASRPSALPTDGLMLIPANNQCHSNIRHSHLLPSCGWHHPQAKSCENSARKNSISQKAQTRLMRHCVLCQTFSWLIHGKSKPWTTFPRPSNP